MNERPAASVCPGCGGQPMGRLRFLFMMGARARCGACGRALELKLSRAQRLAIVLLGAALAALVVTFLEGAALVTGLGGLLLVALVLDAIVWPRVPWNLA